MAGLFAGKGAIVGALLAAVAVIVVGESGASAATTGTWNVVQSPNKSTTAFDGFAGVTCVTPSDCWAVGSYFDGNSEQTLVEHWDGTSWSIVSSPNQVPGPGAGTEESNALNSVSCVSSSDCWAVGFYVRTVQTPTAPQNTPVTSNDEPLYEHWDGSNWALVTPVIVGTTDYQLFGVSCSSSSTCHAVGYWEPTASSPEVFTSTWNGTTWAGDTQTTAGELRGVSCVDASHCWGVGLDASSTSATLVEMWNGTSWVVQSSPNQGTDSNFLEGVSCISPTDCWAVGLYVDDAGGNKTQDLFELWNGTTWS
ncbi:MAG: hypothetical protein ABR498_08970, partial [Candidatus Dormibacteria bacterium]